MENEEMKKYLDNFLNAINDNYDRNEGDIIESIAKSQNLSENTLNNIKASNEFIDKLQKNLQSIEDSQAEGNTYSDWMEDEIKRSISKIKGLSQKQQQKLFDSIIASVENLLDKHKEIFLSNDHK